MNFLHIGGGAGDLDPATNYRDGFSEFVKKHKSKDKKIYVVEANPVNIVTLKKSWKKYKSEKYLTSQFLIKKEKRLNFFLVKKMLLIINFFLTILTMLKDTFLTQ